MDEITTILDSTRPVSDIISDLKEKSVDVPEWSKSLKDYDPSRHKIVTDKFSRKDKIKSDGRVEPASRIHLGLEKLLVKRITEFAFAIPVRRVYHNTEENKKRQQITKAIEAIYKYARIDSENIRRGNAYFASCEIFTIWYVVERPNTLYGFNSNPAGFPLLFPLVMTVSGICLKERDLLILYLLLIFEGHGDHVSPLVKQGI